MEHKQTDISTDTDVPNKTAAAFIVEIKNLSKSFGENHVLTDISINIKKGENLVVLGKSGSGKSVLIKCLVRLMDADTGSIHILGNDITHLKDGALNDVRKKIGFLFQSAALYDSM
ncbi:MAG TPA: ATP-binding cassette domain-containing protein, partial [Chitinophagales bacterium]|nr:ATP-binding cassette domain-containing protein [Chitinophagales bacterium]